MKNRLQIEGDFLFLADSQGPLLTSPASSIKQRESTYTHICEFSATPEVMVTVLVSV